MRGIWPIFLEEELRVIDYFEPVLGLPDTIKAKLIGPIREALVKEALEKHKDILDRFQELVQQYQSEE